MKKPNKIYRKLGGKRSRAGQAFAVARHPVLALRNAFGRDRVARDAAENFAESAVSKHALQKVMATVAAWGETYHGPRLNWIFRTLNTPRSRVVTDTRRPELD